ncbi:MAG: hypothetical protein AB8G77_28245 [Rhodothermales bacterium]
MSSAPVTSVEDVEKDAMPCVTESGSVVEKRLLWLAPAYTRTVFVHFKDEQQKVFLEDGFDYKIVLPDTALTHRLDIWGGGNLCIIGGAFKLKGYDDTNTNKAALAFWYGNSDRVDTRTIHVEGLLFDMAEARDRDALALNDENAIFQVQNVRFENINGDHLGLHPDAIENWGGAKEVRIYKSTVITDHQGFLLSPLQPTQTDPLEYVDIQKVDFRRNDGQYGSYPDHKCPIYLWLVHYQQESCMTYTRGAFLSDVYAKHADSCWDFGMNDAMPNTIQPLGCLAEVNERGDEMSWPQFGFTGVMKQGTPPGGEYVPEGVAGIGYESPGYTSGRSRAR